MSKQIINKANKLRRQAIANIAKYGEKLAYRKAIILADCTIAAIKRLERKR